MKTASNFKRAVIGWIGIYSLITPLIYLLGDIIGSLPIYMQTFILTGISTPLMCFLTPFLNRVLLGKSHK